MKRYSKNKNIVRKNNGTIKGLHINNVIPLVLLSVMTIFVIYPFVMLFFNSIHIKEGISFRTYTKVFSSLKTYKALLNTVYLVLTVLIGTWIIGFILAFIREMTDYKYKKLIDIFVFLSFCIPSFILSVSWIEIVSKGGYFNEIIENIFPGIIYEYNAYSIEASSIVLILHLYPLVYYGLREALKIIDGPLLKNAKITGGKSIRIMFTIIIPLALPSFISTGLLVVGRSMANFAVTAQLALPKGEEVLTTRVFSAMSELNLPVVSVLSLFLVVLSNFLFYFSEKALDKRKYDIKMNNDNSNFVFKLDKKRKIVNFFIFLFFSITVGLPYLTILFSSFFKRWGLEIKKENLTFHNYKILFTQEALIIKPLLNSLKYGIIAGVIAVTIASVIVYFYIYVNDRKSKILMHISQLPIAYPNIIIAISAIFAWINKPFKFYGTKWIIIIAYVVLFIPICIKQILGIVRSIDKTMIFAAQTMGAKTIYRFISIFLPYIKNGIISSFLICFLVSLREIPISLLLYTNNTKTLGVMLFKIQSNSYGLEMTSAVATLVIIISLIGNFILRKLGVRGQEKYE